LLRLEITVDKVAVLQALCIVALVLADLHFTFQQMYGIRCAGIEVVPTSTQVALGLKIASFVRFCG